LVRNLDNRISFSLTSFAALRGGHFLFWYWWIRRFSHKICAALRKVHHSRKPCRLGKYEAKNQIDSPIKIGQKISANR